jgi:hypothetical protein
MAARQKNELHPDFIRFVTQERGKSVRTSWVDEVLTPGTNAYSRQLFVQQIFGPKHVFEGMVFRKPREPRFFAWLRKAMELHINPLRISINWKMVPNLSTRLDANPVLTGVQRARRSVGPKSAEHGIVLSTIHFRK